MNHNNKIKIYESQQLSIEMFSFEQPQVEVYYRWSISLSDLLTSWKALHWKLLRWRDVFLKMWNKSFSSGETNILEQIITSGVERMHFSSQQRLHLQLIRSPALTAAMLDTIYLYLIYFWLRSKQWQQQRGQWQQI